MAASEALSVAVAKGAFVPWHPPQSQSTGTNISFGPTPKVKAGPMDPVGPQFEVDSLSDFRTSRDGSGPSGQIRAPQDKPGLSRTNQGPAERIGAPLHRDATWVQNWPIIEISSTQKILLFIIF